MKDNTVHKKKRKYMLKKQEFRPGTVISPLQASRVMRVKTLIGCLLLAVSLGIFCFWQNNDIVVSRYQYTNDKLPESFDGYTIVQISDLHNKLFGRGQKRLTSVIESEKPDIIVITGDLVDSNHTDLEKALTFIKEAAKIAPLYYVTGNHEYWLSEADFDTLMNQMAELGVNILDNQRVKIENNEKRYFYLIGLSDDSLNEEALKRLTGDLENSVFQVLLAHEPQCLEVYSAFDIDFVFAGHAHGGQVRLPFIGGLAAPDQGLFPEYTAGLYESGNTTMAVSRGLGNSTIPVRVFNRPEVVTVTLHSK